MYIYKLNLMVNDSTHNLKLQNAIDTAVENALAGLNADVQLVSAQFVETDGCDNFGICVSCGTPVSDHGKGDCVSEVSHGAVVDEKWYCDLCLPEDHPEKF